MNSNTQITESFAWEGLLSPGNAVGCFLFAAVVIAVLAWLEKGAASRPKWIPVLALLRLIAVGVVLWMLAGPSKVTTTRETKAKSLGVFVDSSISMSLVDPVDGGGDAIRWQSATDFDEDSPIAILDETSALLGAARNAANRQELTHARKNLEAAEDRLAALDLQSLGLISGGVASGSDLQSLVEEALASMDTSDTNQEFASLNAAVSRATFLANQVAEGLEANEDNLDGDALERSQKVFNWIRAGEDSWLKEIAGQAQVKRYLFGNTTVAVSSNDWNTDAGPGSNRSRSTDLGLALRTALEQNSERAFDSIVVVTDGRHTEKSDPRALASALGRSRPIFVPIGATKMGRDVILHHVAAAKALYRNDILEVESMVTVYGCEGETVRLELLRDDVVVDSTVRKIWSNVVDDRTKFQWLASELGRHKLTVRAVPIADERTTKNNVVSFETEVLEDTMKVLLADNYPRWEFRFLANLFKRDKHVEYEQILFRPNHAIEGGDQPDPTLPLSVDGWARYRVVILGDLPPQRLTPGQQEDLKKFVSERGGVLVVIAGNTAMPAGYLAGPLTELLPVQSRAIPNPAVNGFSLYLTAEGRLSTALKLTDGLAANEAIWNRLNNRLPIYNLSSWSVPRPASHTLIGAANQSNERRSFLSWQNVGSGRVVYVAAPVTYQLRYGQGDTFHHRFWGQLLRWSVAKEMNSGSATVQLSSDKTVYQQTDTAQISARLSELDGAAVAGAKVSVQASAADEVLAVISLTEDASNPGLYRGALDGLPLGAVMLRVMGEDVDELLRSESRAEPVEHTFTVKPSGEAELINPLSNRPLLNELANASRGLSLPPAGVPAVLQQIDWTPEISETVRSEPVWNRWTILALILMCLTFEWIGRKTVGLI